MNNAYFGIGLAVGIGALLMILLVPAFPITTAEKYIDVETHQESQQFLEDRQQVLSSSGSRIIEPGQYYIYRSFVSANHEVEFQLQADDQVNAYIAHSSNERESIATRENIASTDYSFVAPYDDTYSFMIYNPHTGVVPGIGSKNVELYNSIITEKWKEPVTYTKDVQEPVEKSRQVTRNVSIVQMMSGSKG